MYQDEEGSLLDDSDDEMNQCQINLDYLLQFLAFLRILTCSSDMQQPIIQCHNLVIRTSTRVINYRLFHNLVCEGGPASPASCLSLSL